jgi:DNA-binding response OmpR family regulator
MRILVIENDDVVSILVQRLLEKNGYEVTAVSRALEGEKLAQGGTFDCIILDISLPDKNGLDVCRNLRASGVNTAILILSALRHIDTKVSGLTAGADDYLTKPFDNKELIARIETITRRVRFNSKISSNDTLTCGDLKLHLIKREFTIDGKSVWLTNNEFNLMAYLMKHMDKIVDKEELAEKVWGIKFDTQTNFINVYVSYIRKKINEVTDKDYIQTVRNRGFILKSSP